VARLSKRVRLMPAQYLKPCVNRIIRIVSVPSSSRQNRLQRIWVGQHDTEFQTTLVSHLDLATSSDP